MIQEITPRIVQLLEEAFVDKLPKQEVSPYELGLLIGEQRVVDYIKYQVGMLQDEEKK